MNYTIFCECGLFRHDISYGATATLMHFHKKAVVYPAHVYAEMANDALAEAERFARKEPL